MESTFQGHSCCRSKDNDRMALFLKVAYFIPAEEMPTCSFNIVNTQTCNSSRETYFNYCGLS